MNKRFGKSLSFKKDRIRLLTDREAVAIVGGNATDCTNTDLGCGFTKPCCDGCTTDDSGCGSLLLTSGFCTSVGSCSDSIPPGD